MPKEYIEREAAIQRIRIVASGVEFDNPLEAIDTCVAVIDCEPAVDVAEVRHGRWRWVAYDANPKIGNWHCTYCNRIPKSFQKEDFCTNCGAKMDKEDAWKDDALGQKED